GARLGVVDIRTAFNHPIDRGRINFAVCSRKEKNLCAVREKLRGPAFVGFNMRRLVAKDTMIGLAKRRESQGISGCSVENKKNLAGSFENLADKVSRFGGPLIISVAADMALVCVRHRLPGLRTDAGIIVAGELTPEF